MKTNNPLIVMSILTYYAKQIFSGTKKFEFRKSPLKKEFLNKKIYIYSAKEDKAIIGSFKVSNNLIGSLEDILEKTGYDKRSDKNEIISYFHSNTNKCFALELYDVDKFVKPLTLKELRKIDPNISLPQYYDTIKNPDICQLIINHEKHFSSTKYHSIEKD